MSADPHGGPVGARAWEADAEARARGRVQMFNATRPDALDGWTIPLQQYDLLREVILRTIDLHGDEDGTVRLQTVVDEAQRELGTHPAFPAGRLSNFVRFAKVDLEARGVVERVPRSSPQRIRLRLDGPE
ncbi:DUF6958 family protein [uncultured Amnibacterium sp.]|uniref:DUF6958 family protein n=1 Tax=uncultured Amnibacterium sp. TaxID=1631851 RepID=UPI0035CC51D5